LTDGEHTLLTAGIAQVDVCARASVIKLIVSARGEAVD
jgi:hypothetical protein